MQTCHAHRESVHYFGTMCPACELTGELEITIDKLQEELTNSKKTIKAIYDVLGTTNPAETIARISQLSLSLVLRAREFVALVESHVDINKFCPICRYYHPTGCERCEFDDKIIAAILKKI